MPRGVKRRTYWRNSSGRWPRRTASARLRELEFCAHADLLLLHIYDPVGEQMLARSMVSGEDRETYAEEAARNARSALDEFTASHGLGEPIRRAVRPLRSQVAMDIGAAATELGADLVALSRSNKSAIEKTLLGSATDALLRDGCVDLLIFPPDPGERPE